MAPKRRGSVLGAPVMKKKRTVRRPVREPSPSEDSSSSSSTPSAAPVPNPSSPQVDTLAGRMITMGRKVDFHFFEEEGFFIGKRIKDLGWDGICSLDLPTYPALVKEFYFNLSRGDGGLVSSVRGKRIHITADILGKLLGIPVTGLIDAQNDRSVALSRMLGREITEFEEVRANQLPLELRLLHNICSRILFPKTGRFEYVSERDVLLMDSILIGQQIDLAGMMIWYIADAGNKRKSSLPYGMVLTAVFKNQGVVIAENEPMKKLRHTDYYSIATLHRMGFIKKNGIWERKSLLEGRSNEDRATGSEPIMSHSSPRPSSPAPSVPAPPIFTAPSVPSPPIPSSSGFSATQIEQLKELLATQKEEIKSELDNKMMNIRELVYSLEDKVSRIESSIGSSSDGLKVDISHIFEKLKDIGGDSDIYCKSNGELQLKIDVACTFIDEQLKEFMKIQKDGMGKILDELKRLLTLMCSKVESKS